MQILGKIETILNNQLVIISSSESFRPKEIVSVFSIIDNPKLRELGYAEPIYYPEGQLKIVCQHSGDKYLAEVFQETIVRIKKITKPPQVLQRSMVSVFNKMQPEFQEISEEIKGALSAELNEKQSLNIQLAKKISLGDLVGRL